MLALKSVDRWRSADGFFFVTKNHFDPNLRVRYADYSQLTNYNGNVMYHMTESWRARQSFIKEQPAPSRSAVTRWCRIRSSPSPWAMRAACRSRWRFEAPGRRSSDKTGTALGISRFSRVNWTRALARPTAFAMRLGRRSQLRADFSRGGNWIKLPSVPQRYQATFVVTFTHPLLVRCRIDYAPKSGQTGPTFSDDLVITPDGVLSTSHRAPAPATSA